MSISWRHRWAVLCLGGSAIMSISAAAAVPAPIDSACTARVDQPTVRVYGAVSDPQGATLAHVPVVLSCGHTHADSTTDENGRFVLYVAPGDWQMAVTAAGFEPLAREIHAMGRELNADVAMRLAANRTAVEVRSGTDGYVEQNTELGTHTNTPILEIPQGVYEVTQAVLADQQAVRLNDAVRNVSGVSFGNDSGGRMESMVMRGFTTGVQFKDGFRNDGSSTRTFAELSNVERVEILKGPSSTVFGRLDPSGVINLVTKEPQATPQMRIEMQGGSYQFLRPTVDITGPVSRNGRLLGRIIGSGQDSQSFRDFNVQHRLFISPTLTWTPSRSTTVRYYSEFLGGSGMTDRGLIALGTRPANLPISRYLADPALQYPYREGKAGLSLDQALGLSWTLRSYERSSTGHAMYNARIANSLLSDNQTVKLNDLATDQYYQSHYWVNEATGEVRTGALRQTLLIGSELDYELFDTRTLRATNASQLTLNIYNPDYAALPERKLALSRADQTRNGYGSGYAQDQVRYGRLLLTAGIRYDIAKMKTVGYYVTPDSSSRNTAWSPRAGLTYRLTTPLAFYATWSQSFQPQSDLDVNGNPFKPERGKLLETGFKYDTQGHRTTGTLSIFQVDRRNVTTTDPDNSGYSIQVGAQRSRGVEWNQTTRVAGGWSLLSGYAFTQATVTRDNTYLVGTGLAASPRHTGNLWMQYRPTRAAWRGVSLGAGLFGASHSEGQLRTQAAPATYFLLPGYERFDLAASYELAGRGGWSYQLRANAENVLDRRYFAGSGGRFSVYPGAPRTLLFSLTLQHHGERK